MEPAPPWTAEDLARARALTGLLWHLGAFVILNAGFWILDLALAERGVQWAYWITGFWGVGLLFHVLAWLIAGRQLDERLARRYASTRMRRRDEG